MVQQAHVFTVEHAPFSHEVAPDQQEDAVKQPWQRQKNEPGLWWRRYRIYRDMGAKRSLQAAWTKEREKMRVLSGTTDKKKAEQKKPPVTVEHLQEVPKLKSPQAPGSWKVASIKWRWVERCQLYDEHVIDEVVSEQLKVLADGPALAFVRIQNLMKLYDSLGEAYGKFSGSYHDLVALSGRLQSVLRDIREEMAQFDEPFTRVVLQMHIRKLYDSLDSGLEASVNAEIQRRGKANASTRAK